MSDLFPETIPAGLTPLDAESMTKALHSAQFLQSDLHQVLTRSNPLLSELVLRELDVVNDFVVRLQCIESVVRSLV